MDFIELNNEALNATLLLTTEIKEKQEALKILKENLFLKMGEEAILKLSFGGFSFTVIEASQTASIDTTLIKKQSPILYADLMSSYLKLKNIKGYVRLLQEKVEVTK